MRTTFFSVYTWLMVLVASIGAALPARATLYLDETFDYKIGDLYGQGEWIKCGTQANNPIQVINTQLSYDGYADASGKSVELNPAETLTTSDQRLAKLFTDDATTSVTEGSLYYALLLNVKSLSSLDNVNWIVAFQQKRAASWSDNANYTYAYGKLYAKKSGDGTYNLGISRYTQSKDQYLATDLEVGKTYLVVVKYEIVGANTELSEANDIVSLWVNPAVNGSEPKADLVYDNSTGTGNDFRITGNAGGLYAIQLMQYNTATRGEPDVVIGHLRVADSWASLMKQDDEPVEPEKKGTLTASPTTVYLVGDDYVAHKGQPYTGEITVKATDIEHDITVGGLTTGEVTASATTIPKEDAMSENGYTLTVTLNPVTGGSMTDKVVFSCADADAVTVDLAWYCLAPSEVASVSEITETDEYSTLYQIAGPLTVTHRWGNYIYLQDDKGGAVINDSEGLFADVKVDDRIKDLVVFGYTATTGVNLTLDESTLSYTLVGHNLPATPATVTVAELAANGSAKQNMLVKIANVTFGHKSGDGTSLTALSDGETFTTDYTNRVAVQDDSEAIAEIRVLSGSDFIGTTVPAKGFVIGISTAANGSLIAPRTKEDIGDTYDEPKPEPAVNLLDNGSFEKWQSSMFGTSPSDWETQLGECSQETSNVLEGQYALRMKAGTTSTAGRLYQDIYFDPSGENALVAGQKYKLTLHYLVETATADGTDLQLQSYWSENSKALVADADVLNNGEYFTSDGATWTTKEVIVTAPEGANHFYLRLKVGKKAVVLFDDFSFTEYNDGIQSLLVSDEALSFSTTLGQSESKDVTVTAQNINKEILLEVTGDDAAQYSVTPSSIPAGQAKTTVTVTYTPTAASAAHYAALIIDPQTEGVSGLVALIGQNYDPENKPEIALDVTSLDFEAEVGSTQTKSVKVTSQNIIDQFVTAKVVDTESGLFILDGGMVDKNTEATLNITFVPRAAGTFTQTVQFSAIFAETASLALTGVATGSVTPVKEGDDWPLSTLNPRKLLIENFDGADTDAHNKPLSLDGWKNIAEQGGRAWWGFAVDNEDVAKVTAYKWNSDDYDADMWLITPPLDFKNAESKVFTFDVMGQYLSEDNPGKFEVYYMAMDEQGNLAPRKAIAAKHIPSADDGLYYTAIDGLNIPTTSDESDTWCKNQINFTNLDLDDVFFIGFRYSGTGGSNNSATYYIDNVSWGRTDIPVITPEVQVFTATVAKGETFTSQPINVATQALADDVTLQLAGDDADKFSLNTTSLSKDGGDFTFSFTSAETGTYYAYVMFSSQDAATVAMQIGVEVTDASTGINAINVNAAEISAIYDLNGRQMPLDFNSLAKGVYIIRTNDGKVVKLKK